MCPLLVGTPVKDKISLESKVSPQSMWVFGSKRQFIKHCNHLFPEGGPTQTGVILAAISPKQKRDLSFWLQTDPIIGDRRLGREPLYLKIYGEPVRSSLRCDLRYHEAGVANLRKSIQLKDSNVVYVPVNVYAWITITNRNNFD